MRIKTIVDEDFTNYKKPVMVVGTAFCDGKCCREAGVPLSVCQNDEWHKVATIEMADEKIINRYLDNPISKALCFAGLEPFEQFDEVHSIIRGLRKDHNCSDDIVIYTGFYPNEIEEQINILKQYKNIIIKFGRYIQNKESHYDPTLGVHLSSDNQFAVKIS